MISRNPHLDKFVFVFGSNRSGIHGAGAARFAHRIKGAEWGKGEGLTNNEKGVTYALPTKGKNISYIGLDEINKHVDTFLEFANANLDYNFQVTQVGCGLGGFSKAEIAPMFINSPSNCFFDTAWTPILKAHVSYWGTF